MIKRRWLTESLKVNRSDGLPQSLDCVDNPHNYEMDEDDDEKKSDVENKPTATQKETDTEETEGSVKRFNAKDSEY